MDANNAQLIPHKLQCQHQEWEQHRAVPHPLGLLGRGLVTPEHGVSQGAPASPREGLGEEEMLSLCSQSRGRAGNRARS